MIQSFVIDPLKKAWGLNYAIFNNANFELHHASIVAGGYSSCHCHQNKHNLFYVITGELYIHFYGSEKDAQENKIAHSLKISVGESLIVPPKVWHKFYAPENGFGVDLVETYWNSEVNPEDIVRKDVGGVYPE